MMNKFLCILSLGAIVFGYSNAVYAERFEEKIKVNERQRAYILYVPDDVNNQKDIPVIFAFHPALGTGKFMEETTELHKYGTEFIIVYPDGYRRTWNAGGKCCGKANDHHIDDVGFLKAVLNDLRNKYDIQEKVYLTGFSNGSIFSFHLICNDPEMIAAAAPFGATRNMEGCKNNTSIPLLYIHGEVDKSAPAYGGYSHSKSTRDRLGYMHSAQEIAITIAKNNQCTDQSQQNEKWLEPLGTACETWSKGCNDDSSVSACVIPNLGHTWPGAEKRPGWLAKKFGPARPDLKGSQAIIQFFREQNLKAN